MTQKTPKERLDAAHAELTATIKLARDAGEATSWLAPKMERSLLELAHVELPDESAVVGELLSWLDTTLSCVTEEFLGEALFEKAAKAAGGHWLHRLAELRGGTSDAPHVEATPSMATKVHEALHRCFFTPAEVADLPEGQAPADAVIVEVVMARFGLHRDRLEAERELVVECLRELDPAFAEGHSFLALPFTKDKEHWAEHATCDELLALAFGLGLGGFIMPRELWHVLPGGMPYLWLHPEGKVPAAVAEAQALVAGLKG